MAEASRIDVSIEHKHAPEPPPKKHPNTCPTCGSHYRDDELDGALRVCTHCGHHFPVKARQRIEQLTDRGSFIEEAADLRSADPLEFFDLRAYKERLAEAEVATGLGDAMVIGSATIEEQPCELAVFMPEPDGLSLDELEALLRSIAGRSRVAGAGLSGLVADPANEPKLVRLCAALGF